MTTAPERIPFAGVDRLIAQVSTWTHTHRRRFLGITGPPGGGKSTLEIEVVAVSPDYASDQTLFVGTWGEDGSLYKSLDAGATWAYRLLPGSIRVLVFSPGRRMGTGIQAL